MSTMLLLNTIRHLRCRQIVGQLSIRLQPFRENLEAFKGQIVPCFPGCHWEQRAEFLVPGEQKNAASELLRGVFNFLNSPKHLGWPPEWGCGNLPKLWQYNLHYFEWLWALDYRHAREAVRDWISRHDIRRGRVGWEPYTISVRLMNWLCVFFGRFLKQSEEDNSFLNELWRSVFLQVEWLLRHPETHLLGNHLFENGAALAFAGSCFTGNAADKWYRVGLSILTEEIPEQILTDGMHFERSPMYHLRIAYLLVLLSNMGRSGLKELVEAPLVRVLFALAKVCHPDGQIALFNDSAFGIYNNPSELIEAGKQLLGKAASVSESANGAFSLPDAGYYGFRGYDESYIICDAGPIGPDYIPGHAHGDIFSFELSLKGHRVIVDSGVYDYEMGEMRRYCRSTKAHNTVEINGQDQCELWGAFRVARRGHPRDVSWKPSNDGFRLSGWHDGYRRLRGHPRHYREFTWKEPGRLEVRDRIVSSRSVNAVLRLHLHPACAIEEMSDALIISYPKGRFRIGFSGNGKLSVEESFYCPEFGRKIINRCLALSYSGMRIETRFIIEPI